MTDLTRRMAHQNCTDEECDYGDADCPIFVPMMQEPPVPPQPSGRIGDWMQTYTGRAFWPLDPRSEEIDGEDIAHALAQLCRYNGHTKFFYSVAEHCVHVSEWVESVAGPRDALWGLLHDATEAYMGDMIRPLKRAMGLYRQHEQVLSNTIMYKYKLSMDTPEVVHEADNRILLDERERLMTMPPPRPWAPEIEALKPLGVSIDCWTPARAKSEYWLRLRTLERTVNAA